MDDLGLASVVHSARKIHFHNRADRQLVRAGTKKAAETHVFSCRFEFNLISMTVCAPQLEGHAQSYPHFGSWNKPPSLPDLAEAGPQRVEVNGFFEIVERSKGLALRFCLTAAFAADDNHRNLLSVAESREPLKELIAGIFRHAQI